jgi:hypothetical protein
LRVSLYAYFSWLTSSFLLFQVVNVYKWLLVLHNFWILFSFVWVDCMAIQVHALFAIFRVLSLASSASYLVFIIWLRGRFWANFIWVNNIELLMIHSVRNLSREVIRPWRIPALVIIVLAYLNNLASYMSRFLVHFTGLDFKVFVFPFGPG